MEHTDKGARVAAEDGEGDPGTAGYGHQHSCQPNQHLVTLIAERDKMQFCSKRYSLRLIKSSFERVLIVL
jgi:hypothetical protein